MTIVWSIVVLWASTVKGQQTWQHSFGGFGSEQGYAVDTTSENGSIIVGASGSFGSGGGDVYLLRLDSAGEIMWSRTWGGPNVEQGRSVRTLMDGGFLIAGSSNSAPAIGYDGVLIRTDDQGNVIWYRTYGGSSWDLLYDASPALNGYILCGQSFSVNDGSGDIWLIRTDLNGDTLWTRTFPSAGIDEAICVRPTMDGGFIVAGTLDSNGENSQMVLLKYSENGGLEWSTPIGGAVAERARGVTPTADGGYVICGWSESFTPYRTMYMQKVNASGSYVWDRYTFGPEGDWEARSIIALSNGELVVAGFTMAYGAGGKDMYQWHTDAQGDFLDGRTYGGLDDEEANAIVATSDGGFLLVGSTTTFGPGPQSVFAVRNYGEPLPPDFVVINDPLPIEELVAHPQFRIAPVPCSGPFTIEAERPLVRIAVQDATGKVLYDTRMTPTDQAILDLGLAPGLYLVQAWGNDGVRLGCQRLVIAH